MAGLVFPILRHSSLGSLLQLMTFHRRQAEVQELVCITLLLTIPLEYRLDHSPGWPSLPHYE